MESRSLGKNIEYLTVCVDPNRCYEDPPPTPVDGSIASNLTNSFSYEDSILDATIRYSCSFDHFVFKFESIYADVDKTELVHEFDTSVDGHAEIDVVCRSGPSMNDKAEWTWLIEGNLFRASSNLDSIPLCWDPTICDVFPPPAPEWPSVQYEIPDDWNYFRYNDGNEIIYRCPPEMDFMRFADESKSKYEWEPIFAVKCGWKKQWEPAEVPECVDVRECGEPLWPREDDMDFSYIHLNDPSRSVGAEYYYTCLEGNF